MPNCFTCALDYWFNIFRVLQNSVNQEWSQFLGKGNIRNRATRQLRFLTGEENYVMEGPVWC